MVVLFAVDQLSSLCICFTTVIRKLPNLCNSLSQLGVYNDTATKNVQFTSTTLHPSPSSLRTGSLLGLGRDDSLAQFFFPTSLGACSLAIVPDVFFLFKAGKLNIELRSDEKRSSRVVIHPSNIVGFVLLTFLRDL